MAQVSGEELAFEVATNRSYVRALEKRLSRKNPEISVPVNERYTDNIPRGERANVGPLYGRVGLTAPDEDLGVAFYVGARYLAESDWDHRVISWAAPAARVLYDPYAAHDLNAQVLVRRALTVRGFEVVYATDDWTATVAADQSPFRPRPLQIPAPPKRRTPDPVAAAPPPLTHAQRQTSQAAPVSPPVTVQPRRPKADASAFPPIVQPKKPTDLVIWPVHAPLLVDHGHRDIVGIVAHRAVYLARLRTANDGLAQVLIVSLSRNFCQLVVKQIRAIAAQQGMPSVPERVRVVPLPEWLASISGYPPFTNHDHGLPVDAGYFIKGLAEQAVRLCHRHLAWKPSMPLYERIRIAYDVVRYGGLPSHPLGQGTYSREWISTLPTFDTAWGQLRYAAFFAQLATSIRGTGVLPTYDHVVVDQAPEVAVLAWEVLRAHNPTGGWSLFGDTTDHGSAGFDRRRWTAVARRLEISHWPGEAEVVVIRNGKPHRELIAAPESSTTRDSGKAQPARAPRQAPATNVDHLEAGMRAVDSVRFALHAPRAEALTSVLSTLQPDQYRLVTQPPTMPLVIQGHPGTGKTIIAVHRAGFLVNEVTTAKRPVPRVLLLGPTDQYVRHVSRVISELDAAGHITVRSLPSLLAELAGQHSFVKLSEGTPQDVDRFIVRLAEGVMHECQRRPEWAANGRKEKVQLVYEAIRAGGPHPQLNDAQRRWAETLPTFARAWGERRYLPLFAQLGLLAEHAKARYDHIVVDEAQDVSDLEWEIIQALNPDGRWTIVGDLNQRRRSDVSDLDWSTLAKRLGIYGGTDLFQPQVVERGYRSTQPILDFANRLLPAYNHRPASLQTEGPQPAVIRTSSPGKRDLRSIAEAVRLLNTYEGGTAAIIATDPDAIEKLMLNDGWRRVDAATNGDWTKDSRRLSVRTPEAARGVEFDGVVVVEPGYFVRQEAFSGSLYTSLTRANRELVVVHSKPLPDALR